MEAVNCFPLRHLLTHIYIGNGKTISLKTVMKTCGEKGFAPLYVKSFKSQSITMFLSAICI